MNAFLYLCSGTEIKSFLPELPREVGDVEQAWLRRWQRRCIWFGWVAQMRAVRQFFVNWEHRFVQQPTRPLAHVSVKPRAHRKQKRY